MVFGTAIVCELEKQNFVALTGGFWQVEGGSRVEIAFFK